MSVYKNYIVYFTTLFALFAAMPNNGSWSKINNGKKEFIDVVDSTGGKKIAFIFAHQDDEVFIFSKIKEHVRIGDSILFIWTASSHNIDEAYGEERISESEKMLSVLGFDNYSKAYFLQYPDGYTYKYIDEIYDTIMTIFIDFLPNVVYTPAYEGGHPDHDLVNFIVAFIREQHLPNIIHYEFPLYSAYELYFPLPFLMRNYPPDISTNKRSLSIKDFDDILEIWGIYESQHFPLDAYILLTSGREKTFGYEYYRNTPTYNYLQPPPGYMFIAYERYLFHIEYSDFQKAISGFIN